MKKKREMQVEILISKSIIDEILVSSNGNLSQGTKKHLRFLRREITKNEEDRFACYSRAINFLR